MCYTESIRRGGSPGEIRQAGHSGRARQRGTITSDILSFRTPCLRPTIRHKQGKGAGSGRGGPSGAVPSSAPPCGKEGHGGTKQCAEGVHEAPGQDTRGTGILSEGGAAGGLGVPSAGRVPADAGQEGEADVPGEGLPGGGQGLGRALPAGNREPADREPDLSLASDGDGLPRNCHGQFLAMEGR